MLKQSIFMGLMKSYIGIGLLSLRSVVIIP